MDPEIKRIVDIAVERDNKRKEKQLESSGNGEKTQLPYMMPKRKDPIMEDRLAKVSKYQSETIGMLEFTVLAFAYFGLLVIGLFAYHKLQGL